VAGEPILMSRKAAAAVLCSNYPQRKQRDY
jgi:hypothetical protein